MIELLISLRLNGEAVDAKRGDVICAKLAGAPWGEMERKKFLIVVSDDPAVEAQLTSQRDKGIVNPVLTYPYRGSFVRSTKQLPAAAIAAVSDVLDPDVAKDTLNVPLAAFAAVADVKPVDAGGGGVDLP